MSKSKEMGNSKIKFKLTDTAALTLSIGIGYLFRETQISGKDDRINRSIIASLLPKIDAKKREQKDSSMTIWYHEANAVVEISKEILELVALSPLHTSSMTLLINEIQPKL